jgi:hypothetical protein
MGVVPSVDIRSIEAFVQGFIAYSENEKSWCVSVGPAIADDFNFNPLENKDPYG